MKNALTVCLITEILFVLRHPIAAVGQEIFWLEELARKTALNKPLGQEIEMPLEDIVRQLRWFENLYNRLVRWAVRLESALKTAERLFAVENRQQLHLNPKPGGTA